MRVLVGPAVTSTQAPGIWRPWKTQAPKLRTSCSSTSRGQPSTQHHAALCVSCVRASANAAEPRHPRQPPTCLPFQLGVSGAAVHAHRCELCDGTPAARCGDLRPVDAVLAWDHIRLDDGGLWRAGHHQRGGEGRWSAAEPQRGATEPGSVRSDGRLGVGRSGAVGRWSPEENVRCVGR